MYYWLGGDSGEGKIKIGLRRLERGVGVEKDRFRELYREIR